MISKLTNARSINLLSKRPFAKYKNKLEITCIVKESKMIKDRQKKSNTAVESISEG